MGNTVIFVSKGQPVKLGMRLGTVGHNPIVPDPLHLHFELSPVLEYAPLNPRPYLEGAKVLSETISNPWISNRWSDAMSTPRDMDVDQITADDSPRLLDLDDAVAFLRGAYARRTLQNLAWSGKVRHIGRGERMRFLMEWLLEDLLALRRMDGKESGDEPQRKDHRWNSDQAAQSVAKIGASAPDARPPVGPRNDAHAVARTRPRASRSTGTLAASGAASLPTAGANKTRVSFFKGRRRTTGGSKR
jgi:hypothetical protein